MKPLDQPKDLRRYYEDQKVVDQYMQRRTAQPLNGLLHRRQTDFLNRVVHQRGARAVLEIACGPGRLTADMRGVALGVAVDASQPMLETARKRVGAESGNWSFLRTDAFVLPFRDHSFDAVYTCRFVRHFQAVDRERLYAEVQRVLRPGGVFLVDALNREVSYAERVRKGLDKYHIYDVLYSEAELQAELTAAGFRVAEIDGILRHFPLQRQINRLRRVRLDPVARWLINTLERIPGTQANTWMVVCETKS